MTTTIQAGKMAFVGFIVAVLCATAFAPSASAAQTYYYPTYPTYQTQANAAEIQVLLNQLYTLIAQVQALQAGSGVNYTYTYTPPHTTKKVYDIEDRYKDYDVEVETEDVDVDGDDEATFYGEVDLGDADEVEVWFVYGQDGDMDEETDSIEIDDSDDESFDIDVDDLDEDERYYVRAVAKDPSGYLTYGDILAFTSGGNDDDDDDDDDDNDDDDNDEDKPEATTEDAEDVDDDSAEIHGEIEMNDFEDGLAFFVYGEDEDLVEDVADEDSYSDIDEEGDDLRKIKLASGLDGDRSFWASMSGLDDDTDYFFRICVEYEDEDDDQTLECGDVEEFTTDN